MKWLVVGAGFTGAVAAERLASQKGATVVVIDRRGHIGGNAFDCRNDAGHLIHLYGPHIFHTNSARIMAYLSQFTGWRKYEHRVRGMIDGQLVPIPFNLTTLKALFPKDAERLTERLEKRFGAGAHVPVLKLREAPDADLRDLGETIYEKVFLGYTTKQWGLRPEELSPSVTARVPVRVSHDDRYFQDTHQAMPADGYTKMFERILDHANIQVRLETDFGEVKRKGFDGVIHTGAVDEFFGYRLGELPYRSMRFELSTHPVPHKQPVGTVNYPNGEAFTRVTDMSYLTQTGASTTICVEYPGRHIPGETDPDYPVPCEENGDLHRQYMALARKEAPHVHFAGRLGDYQYYNMDQAVGRALSLVEKLGGASYAG